MASARGISRYIVGNRLPRRRGQGGADERISIVEAGLIIGAASIALWIVLGFMIAEFLR